MIERLLIVLVLAAVGWTLCYGFNAWRVRVARATAKVDPLLTDFQVGVPAIVLFTADYCAHCKYQQKPALARLATETKVQIFQVDVQANPDAAERWGVLSLPTTYILDRQGQPRGVNHGVTSTETLKRQLEGL